MDEKDFEKLLEMARSENSESILLALEIGKNAKLTKCDQTKLASALLISMARDTAKEIEMLRKSLYPFKKQ